MQVILTASDLAAMPAALRQDLLAYLATRRKSSARGRGGEQRGSAGAAPFEGLAVLDRGQAMELVRDVSFGQKRRDLHDLLEALAYETDADAPVPDRLARLLHLDDTRHLRRYFDAIRRLLRQSTEQTAPLLRYSRGTRSYLVHPVTRGSLREVFAGLAKSGEGEEPPWA
jgi:hypothetical protein